MNCEKRKVHKGYHCAWQIHYHIVFPVKYRKFILDKEVVKIIRETTLEIQNRYEIEMERLGCDGDHIHLLCGAHPKHSPGEIVRIYKSITAREVFRRKPEVKKELWGGHFWSAGYYVGTVGEGGNLDVIENYVRTQGGKKENIIPLSLFD